MAVKRLQNAGLEEPFEWHYILGCGGNDYVIIRNVKAKADEIQQ